MIEYGMISGVLRFIILRAEGYKHGYRKAENRYAQK